MIERPEWHGRARCGRNGVLGDDPAVRIATMFTAVDASVCEGCPVRAECATAGRFVQRLNGSGVWAGRLIGSRARCCEICDAEFTSTTRRVTCSEACAREKARRFERKRAFEARQRRFADRCCELCHRVRHDPSCPNAIRPRQCA